MFNTMYNDFALNCKNDPRMALVDEVKNYIIKLASSYAHLGQSAIKDLLQEGICAALKASESFDTSKNVKFITFAYPYIKGAMFDYVRLSNPVYISRRANQEYMKISKAIKTYVKAYGNEPTCEELEELTGISVQDICQLLDAHRYVSMDEGFDNDVDQVNRYDRYGVDMDSDLFADDPIGYDEYVKEVFMTALNNMPEKKRMALVNRIGYYCDERKKKEIAASLGVTSQRVGQLFQEAVEMLSENKKIQAIAHEYGWDCICGKCAA